MRRLSLVAGFAVLAAVAAGVLAAPAGAQSQTAQVTTPVFLYVDTVNGTRPANAKPRPIGCAQSNNFVRGEQVVFRSWGSEAQTQDILSTENVVYAYVKIPGQPNLKLNWGGHGRAGSQVWFWANAWNIPVDYPLGTLTARVVFKTEAGEFGTYDYTLNILPTLPGTKSASKSLRR